MGWQLRQQRAWQTCLCKSGVLVSLALIQTSAGLQVYALVDLDGSRRNVSAHTVLTGRTTPNGVAYANGSLWVTENNATTRYDGVVSAAVAGKACSSLEMLINAQQLLLAVISY